MTRPTTKPSPEAFAAIMRDMRNALEGEYVIPPGIDLMPQPLPPKQSAPSGRYWLTRIREILQRD